MIFTIMYTASQWRVDADAKCNKFKTMQKNTIREILGEKKSTVLNTFAICGLQMALTF